MALSNAHLSVGRGMMPRLMSMLGKVDDTRGARSLFCGAAEPALSAHLGLLVGEHIKGPFSMALPTAEHSPK